MGRNEPLLHVLPARRTPCDGQPPCRSRDQQSRVTHRIRRRPGGRVGAPAPVCWKWPHRVDMAIETHLQERSRIRTTGVRPRCDQVFACGGVMESSAQFRGPGRRAVSSRGDLRKTGRRTYAGQSEVKRRRWPEDQATFASFWRTTIALSRTANGAVSVRPRAPTRALPNPTVTSVQNATAYTYAPASSSWRAKNKSR